MKIQIRQQYRSIDVGTFELPRFVVLTGLNGVGKTQFLECIKDQTISEIYEGNTRLNHIRHVAANALVPTTPQMATSAQLALPLENIWSVISNIQGAIRNNPLWRHQHLESQLGNMGGARERFLAWLASEKKDVMDVTAADISQNILLISEAPHDLFQHNISALFKRYQLIELENEFRHFRVSKGESVKALSKTEFTRKFGIRPWDFLNSAFEDAKLNYRITSPETDDRDTPFEARLINQASQAEVGFGDISSGERVLLSLAIAVYNASRDMRFPELLLLDEPDAFLHPSMVKHFLSVIQETFIAKSGMAVILTTHSPTTVALCPDEAIFVMTRPLGAISHQTKDAALRALLLDVPTLSVNYENRRQVFVESKNDAVLYDVIYRKLASKLIDEVSLNFISSGDKHPDSGSDSQAKRIVKTLRDNGVKTAFGVIDWDGKNSESESVKVLGVGVRYTLENCIFDPLILGMFLLLEREVDKEKFGITSDQPVADMRLAPPEKLQVVVDFVVAQLAPELQLRDINVITKIEYCTEFSLDVPTSYLSFNGHALEDAVRKVYRKFNRYKTNELKMEIVKKVFDDFPNFIPMDFLSLFRKLQAS